MRTFYRAKRNISALLLVICFIFTNTLTANASSKTDSKINTVDFMNLVISTLGYTQKSDKTFIDVPKGSEYEEIVSKAIAAGLITHKEKTSLKPEMYMSKASALSILAVAFRADEERVKSALEINTTSDENSNFSKELASKAVKELVGVRITGDSSDEKTLDTAYVAKKGAKISNLTANTLIISPSVEEGSITLENVNIANLIVLKEGAKNITLIDSTIDHMIVANEGVSLTAEGHTVINKLTVNAEAVSLKSNVTGSALGFKEISLEYQPSVAITNGTSVKSKLVKVSTVLKLEGKFALINIIDNINKLSIMPQKESSAINVSKIQLSSNTNVLQVWYRATIASIGLSNESKLMGSVSVEIQNSSGITVRKDTAATVNALINMLSELSKNARLANVDSEVFASHNIPDKTVSYNTKIKDLEMPNTIQFTSNQSQTVTGSIVWDYGKYDPKIAGKYIITGQVSGTNMSWTPQNVDITVTVEEMLTFTIPFIQVVIPANTSETELCEKLLPQTATATLSNGKTVTVKISNWECTGVFDPDPSISTNYIFIADVYGLPASAGWHGQVIATVVVQLSSSYYPYN